jgi:hypothetical protein
MGILKAGILGRDVLRSWPRAVALALSLAVVVYVGHVRSDDSPAGRRSTDRVHIALIDTGARLDLPEFFGY